jgi:hypothetical protein
MPNLRGAQSRNRVRVRPLRESDATSLGTGQWAKGPHAAGSTGGLLQLRQDAAAQEQVLRLLRDVYGRGAAGGSGATTRAASAAHPCSPRGGPGP